MRDHHGLFCNCKDCVEGRNEKLKARSAPSATARRAYVRELLDEVDRLTKENERLRVVLRYESRNHDGSPISEAQRRRYALECRRTPECVCTNKVCPEDWQRTPFMPVLK